MNKILYGFKLKKSVPLKKIIFIGDYLLTIFESVEFTPQTNVEQSWIVVIYDW